MKGPRMLSFIRKYLPLVSDFLIMMILTLVFIIMSVWNLGRISVPVTTAYLNTSGDEGFYIDLYDVEKVKSVVFLVKKNQGPVNIKMCTGYPVNSYCKKENLEGYYKWRSISFEAETQRILFVFDSSRVEIAEIAVIGEVNKIIPIKSITGNGIDSEVLRNLIDEQDKIEYPSTYISETYFDEIYFVRTAEEYLRLEEPFEWTHPPLGKLIIALGILVFGYSPFGWRIMGVIFAGLMIPVMYLLGKRLFGTRRAAFISAFLWVFEFMHFTMGRISTVDTYVTFFSLISHLFFLIYLQGVLKGKPNDRNLLLAVIFFALGFSTKWITIYGFIGDVLLLLMLRFKTLSKTGLKWAQRVKELFNYPVSTLAGFIIFAIVIYFTTFIPYMMIGHSLIDVFSLQWSMYYYHATLKATHPFESPWWSWPIIQKPVWLYVSYLPDRMVSTIVCMGNPAIWWPGILCLILVAGKAFLRREFQYAYVITIFLAQWIFYAAISRCTFLYHFYSDVPFLVFSIACVLNEVCRKNIKYGGVLTALYLTVVLAVFILYYPVISGQPCPIEWKDSLRLLKTWVF